MSTYRKSGGSFEGDNVVKQLTSEAFLLSLRCLLTIHVLTAVAVYVHHRWKKGMDE